MSTTAAINLWGRTVGAVTLADDAHVAAFEYDAAFVSSGIQVAPLTMPLSKKVYTFGHLSPATFRGLPGLLADALPDKFGNALIDAWLARRGRTPQSFNAVERLCYTGQRGMGALEFEPSVGPKPQRGERVELHELVELASNVLRERAAFRSTLKEKTASDPTDDSSLRDILQVGTSAGGARAKAVIAWNSITGEVRSGQVDTDAGFEHWLLKFDGVSANRDKELDDPQGYGAVEYAYFNMARAAGITMSDCRLLEEGGRRHFMTRRFDRTAEGKKLHLQSLCALAHLDFNAAAVAGYEQAIAVTRQLGLSMNAVEEQFRRMVFNVVARNQDDHTKNIAFLMNKAGEWSLSPAYDVTYSYNPSGAWTATHQMTVNGKRDGFDFTDLDAVAKTASMKRGRAKAILGEVCDAVKQWEHFAHEAKVKEELYEGIVGAFRLAW